MHYDFVDIGTCDFDTSIEVANEHQKVLLVEPLKFYLDRLPSSINIIKSNLAVGNYNGLVEVKYVPEQVIEQYSLPTWLKGCSCIGEYHYSMIRCFQENNIPLSLVQTYKVEIIKFQELCSRFNIESIEYLKIDTEGHEQYILPDVLDVIRQGVQIKQIKFENQEVVGNKPFLDALVEDFIKIGYIILEKNSLDTILTLQPI